MMRKVMVIATAAVAATLIALFSNDTPQAQGTIQANATRAETRSLMPGDILPAETVDFIERPGIYGLGSELPGSRYAIVDGHLVRVNPNTMQLQSILRRGSSVE
ncbi:hypothetical protein RAH32_03180 [Paracoccus sp. WLY502]|uniref:hypothetical protein n=1 Tax=Paracoccus yibinensis TaxID=3068891 RepID=UPI0027963F97|nr:hypothetical protein [Paracoccus sp. WLY502]MDQ1899448.1 hypothetical protein [Paracoccus sp. WLY502]